eukprot:UN33328
MNENNRNLEKLDIVNKIDKLEKQLTMKVDNKNHETIVLDKISKIEDEFSKISKIEDEFNMLSIKSKEIVVPAISEAKNEDILTQCENIIIPPINNVPTTETWRTAKNKITAFDIWRQKKDSDAKLVFLHIHKGGGTEIIFQLDVIKAQGLEIHSLESYYHFPRKVRHLVPDLDPYEAGLELI